MYIVAALLLGALCVFPAFAHSGEDAHSAPAVLQANVPMELVAGTVLRTTVENRATGATTEYVALRGDDGKLVALIGTSLDTLQQGARAEAIGWPNGSAFTVSDSRMVATAKAQTNLQPAVLQVEGTLMLAHLDFLDSGRGEYLSTVRDDAGHVTRVNLASTEAVAPGMHVIARGTLSADARSLDVVALTITSLGSPKARTAGNPVGQAITNNVLVVLLKFTESPAADPFTQAQVQDTMTNAATGVAQYYQEVSYGRQILNVTVTNWLVGLNPSTHAPMATPPGCDFDTMGTYGDAAAANAGFTGSYQNRFYVMPANGACGFSGVAYIGGDTAWSNGWNDIRVYAHELGHNFGLYHAASLTCAAGAAIGGSCSSSEYGDPFDVMGNISAMHFNSMQKSKLGWLPASSVKTQGPGFQQYTLDALENSGGTTYAVTIPIAANPNRTYWIEYRQPLGFDAAIPASNASGAQIRVANPFETCTGCQVFLGMQISDDTELLDMTAAGSPGNFNDAALAVGSTFNDSAYGISVQVLSADTSHLVLNVTTPGGTTSPTTTTLASSLNPAMVGNNVNLTATVTGSAPTGTLKFTDSGAIISGCGAVTLTGAGNTRTATCATAALTAGAHSIAAAYSGDSSNAASSSSPLSQIVNAATSTTTSIASASNPSSVGASVTLTASVTGSAPTGLVSFTDGGATVAGCGAIALGGSGNTRTAACTTSALGAGSHSIVAAYGGDGVNLASSSAALSQVVSPAATTTTLASSANPSLASASVTFTASVTGNAPTGTIIFTDGGTTIGTCSAVAVTGVGNTRTAACSTNALTVGTHSVAATYSGNSVNATSTSAPLSQVVNPAATTTTLASSANPSLASASVTFTASVTGSSPTGTINFMDGGATIGTCSAVAVSGTGNTLTAACSTSGLAVGTHSVVATYSGNAVNATSSSAILAQVVNNVGSTTTLSSGSNPSTVGASVAFTASVTGSAPTGPVSFTDGGVAVAGCGAIALGGSGNTRTAVCTTSALSAGSHAIGAAYAGDAGNAASTSTILSQVVNKLASTTGLASSANPASAGASVTLTATVTGTTPTGAVTFADGGTTIAGCSALALVGGGNAPTASCTTSAFSAGTHSVVAAYGGDGINQASSSAALSQVVNPAATTTTLASSANPTLASASVTFTASVTGNAPTGTVIFTDGGATIASCSAVAVAGAGNTRTAACSTTALTVGTHSVAATYSGNAVNATSTSAPLSQVVNPAATTTALGSSANPSLASASVTFTASVTGSSPTGTINFADGGTTIGACSGVALTGAGNTLTAACSTGALAVGTHSVVATYSGNAVNATSSSGALSQVVSPAATTTTLASSANPSLASASVTFTASVTGNAPTGTVIFTDGGTTIGTCSAVAVTGAGNTRTAACSTNALTVGTHSVAATYSGNSVNATSTSAILAQVVNNVGSTATLSTSVNPSTVGANLTFTATVSGASPTGTVGFTNGGTTIVGCGGVALAGTGNTRTALCTTSALSPGIHSIIAAYSGDGANTSASSGPLMQSVAGPAPVLTGVTSRKVHGAAGTFDLPLSMVPSNPTTEPRQGPLQTIVFTFDKAITSATAMVIDGAAVAAAPTFSGNSVIVALSGVTNQQYVAVALSNVSSADGGTGGSGNVRVGFLLGDVSQNRVVTLSDLLQVNAALAHLVTSSNYLKDINASGTLTFADIIVVNANLARALPAP